MELQHFYHGNVTCAPQKGIVETGITLIAASPGAESSEWVVTGNVPGSNQGPASMGHRWQQEIDYDSVGVFNFGANGAVVAQFQRVKTSVPRNMERSPYIYHMAILSLQDLADIGGNWGLITQNKLFNRPLEEVLCERPSNDGLIRLPKLKIESQNPVSERAEFVRASINAARKIFGERSGALRDLLSSLFDGGKPVTIRGLPENRAERESIAIALAALIPPPMRALCTFATQVTTPQGCGAHFKFLDSHHVSDSDHRMFSWERGQFEGVPPPMYPYVDHVIKLFDQGNSTLIEFLISWNDKAERLLLSHPNDALSMLYNWVAVKESWREQEPAKLNIDLLAQMLGVAVDEQDVDTTIGAAEREQWTTAMIRAFAAQRQLAQAKPYNAFLIEILERHAFLVAPAQRCLMELAGKGDGEFIFDWIVAWFDEPTESLKLDASWKKQPELTAQAHNAYLVRQRQVAKADQFLAKLDQQRQWIATPAIWSDILTNQLRLAKEPAFTPEHAGLLLRLITTLRREELAPNLTGNPAWIQALPAALKGHLLHLVGSEGNPPAPQTDFWPDLAASITGTDEDKSTTFIALMALFLDRQMYSPFKNMPTLNELIKQAERGNKDAMSELLRISRPRNAQELPFEAAAALLAWNFRVVAARRKSPADAEPYQGNCYNLFTQIAPTEVKPINGLIQFLAKEKVDARLLLEIINQVLRDEILLWLYYYALLSWYSEKTWESLGQTVELVVAGLDVSQQRNLGSKLRPRVLGWFMQHPDTPIADRLLTWWIQYASHADSLQNMIGILNEVGSQLGKVPLLKRTFEQRLREQLETVVSDDLKQIQTVAESQKAEIVANVAATLLMIREFIPNGDIVAFAQRLREALQFLGDLDRIYSEDNASRKNLELLQDELIKLVNGRLDSNSRDEFADRCTKLGQLVYKMGEDYGTRDRGGFRWLTDRIGAHSRVESGLAKGNIRPRSAVGFLHWIYGVIRRITTQY